MEFEYTSYRTREGTFFRPSIDLTFKYRSRSFPYQAALIDTGSDFVMLPMSIAEILVAEPDLESATELHCACGRSFKSYSSRYPIELSIKQQGFRPKSWQTHVKFVEPEVTVLLGHRGFLDRFDVTFYGDRHRMKLEEKHR